MYKLITEMLENNVVVNITKIKHTKYCTLEVSDLETGRGCNIPFDEGAPEEEFMAKLRYCYQKTTK